MRVRPLALAWALPGAVALLVATAASGGQGSPEPEAGELWAGRWILAGSQKVPVFGEVKTRTERLVIADVHRSGDRVELVERPCAIHLGTIAGVRLTTRDENARELPPVHIQFEKRGGELRAGPWRSLFGRGEGEPTLEVKVESPICGGTLQLATDALAIARARPRRDGKPGLEGEVRAKVQQIIADATGSCLRKFAKDVEQQLTGELAFVRVPDGSTCASLVGKYPLVPSEEAASEDEGPFAKK